MALWSASRIGKRVSLLGVLAVSVWLLSDTPANGQAATAHATSTPATRKVIQTAQERLEELGYKPGAADGAMSATAVAALKKFQSDYALPVTGQLDRRTLLALIGEGAKAPNAGAKSSNSSVGTGSANATATQAKEKYQSTDLPFKAEFVLKRGGGFQDAVTADGTIKSSCIDVALQNGLNLGDRGIPLKSTDLTTDCMIETKDYGDLQVKFNSATYSSSVLVKPWQEKLFMKLIQLGSATPSVAPSTQPATAWTIQQAKVVALEKLNTGTLVTVRLPLNDPDGTKGVAFLTSQSPFVISKSGTLVLWSGWMDHSPQDDAPALWHPLTPASIEVEISNKDNGELGIDTRAVEATQMSLKK